MQSRRSLIVLFLLGVAALVWAVLLSRQTHTSAEPASGPPDVADAGEQMTLRFFRNPAATPAFAMRDLDGRALSSSSLRGKVVLLNFWATWCPPCRAEIPDLIALQTKYRDQLQIIGISEDEAPPEVVKRFVSEHRMNYPVVMKTPELGRLFPGVVALPTSFVLDRESRIVQKHVGQLTAATTEAETRALAGLPVNARIEQVDQTQGLKLENGAQATNIPGVDLAALTPERRTAALQKLNGQPCTCGCDLTVARCRVDDPNCGVSLPLARDIVKQIANQR
jgi:thiol-disulfide isomerase/thioredoxin